MKPVHLAVNVFQHLLAQAIYVHVQRQDGGTVHR